MGRRGRPTFHRMIHLPEPRGRPDCSTIRGRLMRGPRPDRGSWCTDRRRSVERPRRAPARPRPLGHRRPRGDQAVPHCRHPGERVAGPRPSRRQPRPPKQRARPSPIGRLPAFGPYAADDVRQVHHQLQSLRRQAAQRETHPTHHDRADDGHRNDLHQVVDERERYGRGVGDAR